MAIWQFKLEFVPESALVGKTELSEDEWTEQSWWSAYPAPIEYAERFSSLLPPLKSWSEDLHQWGTQEGDLIEVWVESGTVESIAARIDCRELNPQFIRSIFEAAREWKCGLVYSRYRNRLPETLDHFIEAIWNSPSHQVVRAPNEWLPKLAKEVEDANKNR